MSSHWHNKSWFLHVFQRQMFIIVNIKKNNYNFTQLSFSPLAVSLFLKCNDSHVTECIILFRQWFSYVGCTLKSSENLKRLSVLRAHPQKFWFHWSVRSVSLNLIFSTVWELLANARLAALGNLCSVQPTMSCIFFFSLKQSPFTV